MNTFVNRCLQSASVPGPGPHRSRETDLTVWMKDQSYLGCCVAKAPRPRRMVQEGAHVEGTWANGGQDGVQETQVPFEGISSLMQMEVLSPGGVRPRVLI